MIEKRKNQIKPGLKQKLHELQIYTEQTHSGRSAKGRESHRQESAKGRNGKLSLHSALLMPYTIQHKVHYYLRNVFISAAIILFFCCSKRREEELDQMSGTHLRATAFSAEALLCCLDESSFSLQYACKIYDILTHTH